MNRTRPIRYAKPNCPLSAEAREVLEGYGIRDDERIVTTDATICAEMMRVSGQTKAPVLDWSGEVLADFGVTELMRFLAENVLPCEEPS